MRRIVQQVLAAAKRSPKRAALAAVALIFILLMLTVTPEPQELRGLPATPDSAARATAKERSESHPGARTGAVVETQRGEPESTPWDEVMDTGSIEVLDEKKAVRNQNQWTDRELDDFKRRERENRVVPLLPAEFKGVRIEIDGLSGDGKTIELSVSVGERTEHEAHAIFREFLRDHDDTGKNYHATLIP